MAVAQQVVKSGNFNPHPHRKPFLRLHSQNQTAAWMKLILKADQFRSGDRQSGTH
jgi:hypothetical protein